MKKFDFAEFFFTLFASISILCAVIGFVTLAMYEGFIQSLFFVPLILFLSIASGFGKF